MQPSKTRPPDFFVILDKHHIGDENGRKATLNPFFPLKMCLLSEQPLGEVVWAADEGVHRRPMTALGQTRFR